MSLDLEPNVRKRLESAWADPEVTQGDVRERFRLSAGDVEVLKAQLGPKAALGAISRWSINAIRKQQRKRAALAAKAVVR